MRARPTGAVRAAGVALWLVMMLAGGCSTVGGGKLDLPPVAIEKVEYYPYLVKDFQGSFPRRSVAVLTASDDRSFKDAGHEASHQPYQGHPAIGVILDQHGKLAQQLYGPALGPLFGSAIAQAADEAGMKATTTPASLADALKARGADYVMVAKVTGLWVVKQRGTGNEGGPIWFSAADAMLDVSVYKPPFSVPFWHGQSAAEYDDPPRPAAGALPEDETEIYDHPGEVLSVALTRAVAGIFRRNDLHTLILQDQVGRR